MRALLSIAVALLACKKDGPPPTGMEPPSTKEQDALWALAPAGARGGIVASPRAIAMAEAAIASIRSVLDLPELAEVKQRFDEAAQKELGTTTLTTAEYGMTRERGMAVFLARDGMIAILPVAARDKFLARVQGTKGADADRIGELVCKSVQNVYACASSESMFATLGKGDLRSRLGEARARGDIEVIGVELPLGGTGLGTVAAVVQLGRGAIAIRGAVLGIAEPLLKRFAATTAPRASTERSSGFAVAHAAPFAEQVPALPIGNTTLAAAMKTLKGPLTLDVPAGALALDARQELSDPGPLMQILESCPGLAAFAGLSATFADGVCKLAAQGLELDLWVEGNTFRLGKKGSQATGTPVPMTALGKELAGGAWAYAFWGRGTIFGEPRFPVPGGAGARDTAVVMRAVSLLNELGGGARVDGTAVRFLFAARSVFTNPDDVLAKLMAIDPMAIADGRATVLAKQVADGSPQSPFAADFAAGPSGLMIPMAMVGMTAAIAIPIVMDSQKKPKKSEVLVQLDKIGKIAQEEYVANAAFIIGDTGLTPPTSCCAQNAGGKRRCADADWSTPTWKALDFAIDRPHLFQYSYKSDGKTFTATAVGDADCDGTFVTYELRGEAANGVPQVTLVEPPPNSD